MITPIQRVHARFRIRLALGSRNGHNLAERLHPPEWPFARLISRAPLLIRDGMRTKEEGGDSLHWKEVGWQLQHFIRV